LKLDREVKVDMSRHGSREGAHFTVLRHIALPAVALCTLSAVARADPANTQTVADAQCMVVGARLSASSDPQQRRPGQMILMYYLGRIDGRSPNTDLKTLIKTETQKMTKSELETAASRCGKEFSARGEEIVRIGKSLSKPATR
jgi:hypothetical protein